jgi:hypothetical protein
MIPSLCGHDAPSQRRGDRCVAPPGAA